MGHELCPIYGTSRRWARKMSFRLKPWIQSILNPILNNKPIWKLNFIDNINHWIIAYWLILAVGWDLVTLTVYKCFLHIQTSHKLEILDPRISNLSLSLSYEIQIPRPNAKASRKFLRVFSLSFTFIFKIVGGTLIIYQVYVYDFIVNSW